MNDDKLSLMLHFPLMPLARPRKMKGRTLKTRFLSSSVDAKVHVHNNYFDFGANYLGKMSSS